MSDPGGLALLAVAAGAVVFLAVLVPMMVVQSHRFGGLSLTRIVAFGMFFVHLMALGTYTMLPLPERGAGCVAVPVQTRPLAFLDDIAAQSGGGPLAGLGTVAFWQWGLNVVLFVPLGVFTRRLLEWPWWLCCLVGVGVSGVIEYLQYSAVLGLFPCRWRVADVDDLLANSLGTVLGVALAPVLLGWVSGVRALQRRRLAPRPVTRLRRLAAMSIDLGLCLVLGAIGSVSLRLLLLATERPELQPPATVDVALGWWLPGLLVFALPALGRDSVTPGERLTWLRPRWRPGAAGVGRRLLRVLVLGVVPCLLGGLRALEPTWPLLVPGGFVVWSSALLVGVLITPRGLDGVLSDAVLVDAREPVADQPKNAPSV